MPKKMEKALQDVGKAKGLSGDELDRFVYGTLRKTGRKPKREKRGSE